MNIDLPVGPLTRAQWRSWLHLHYTSEAQCWLLISKQAPPRTSLTYLDAVEEAICFGWIDGIAKRLDDQLAQRFTPRRPKSHWTELNKARARRMIDHGLMSASGLKAAPDLTLSPLRLPPRLKEALKLASGALEFFTSTPDAYQRVRISYLEEMVKRHDEYQRRLNHLVKRSEQGQLFGNWDDHDLERSIDLASYQESLAKNRT